MLFLFSFCSLLDETVLVVAGLDEVAVLFDPDAVAVAVAVSLAATLWESPGSGNKNNKY